MRRIAGAVLAAGAGRRMGAPKAGLVVDGTRLLDRAVAVLRAAGCSPVLAVVAPGTPAPGVRAVLNPDPARGQRSSLALAVAAAGGGVTGAGEDPEALAVVLVDTPGVGVDAVRAVIGAWSPGRIAVGSYRGRRGHPIVMSLPDWQLALGMAAPDEGARALLATAGDRVDEIAVEGDPVDLDTPADLARWEGGRPR